MGNRSYVYDCDLTVKDWDKLYAVAKLTQEKTPEIFENKEINKDKYKDIIPLLKFAGVGEVDEYEWEAVIDIKEYIKHGNIQLDWNEWKIQGYWYKSTVQMLYYLWLGSVRGKLYMSYEGNQDYTIRFEDEGVLVDIYFENEYDDNGNYIEADNEIEDTFEISELNKHEPIPKLEEEFKNDNQ